MTQYTLEKSIANIKDFREACFYIGNAFIQPDSAVIDVCSGYGDAIAPFIQSCDESNSFVLIDNDLDALRTALRRFDGDERVDVWNNDVTHSYPGYSASLTLLVGALQHLPIPYRSRVLRSAYHATIPGGAIILAEQVAGPGYLDELFKMNVASLLDKAGIQPELDEGVPLPAQFNEQLLHDAGFRIIDCFYRHYNFSAWIAIKDE
jgi:tRNA (cmo5U34)-methyltransferase